MIFNDHIIKTQYNGYGGSERKMAVIMDDRQQYLLKFPDPTRDVNNNISYINNAISEHLSCEIFKSIGIPVQETILGEYTDDKGVTKIVCACKDVRMPGEEMCEIGNVLSGINTDDNSRHKLTFEYMDKVFNSMPQVIPKEQISDFYYDMFVVDALIGNTDRHNGNWAILQSMDGARISPVYDCGSSLCPLLDDKFLSEEQGAKEALKANSALSDSNGKRIRYFDYFKGDLKPQIQEALKRIVPKINLNEILRMINSAKYVSRERKDFSSSFIMTSYERILIPALEKTLSKGCEKMDINHTECYNFYKNIIKPLKESALYENQSLDKFGFPEYSYSKAGNSHILLYKGDKLLNLISTRSNDRETRINYSKIVKAGINVELFYENSRKYQSELQKELNQNLQIERPFEDIEDINNTR